MEKKETLEDLKKRKILEQRIKSELIQSVYPRDVAKKLKIKTWQVYEYIENLSKEEEKQLKQNRLKNNKLYNVIILRKKKEKAQGNTNGVVEKILYDMNKSFIDYESRINLARIYFILGNGKAAERILSQMMYDSSEDNYIKNKIKDELDKVHLENLATKMRDEYKNGHNIDGSKISYSDLCSKYTVRVADVVDTLGMEHSDLEL